MNRSTTKVQWAAAVAALLLLTACTGETGPRTGGTPSPTSPETTGIPNRGHTAVEDVDCASDIAGVVIGTVRCQVVTVPEDRSPGVTAGGSQAHVVNLHVTRLEPPGGARNGRPILVAGTNIGATPNYLGLSPLAQRTGREVIIVDARGTGHSTPSLDCPEVHSVAEAELSSDSDTSERAVNDAIAACADRLRQTGTDVTQYGVAAMGADLRDVRTALNLDDIDVAAYGSTSLAVAEMMRIDADGVRAVLLDSPVFQTQAVGHGVAATLPAAVDALLAACRHDRQCAQHYLSGGETLQRARAVLTRGPLTMTLPPRAGRPGTLLLDEERFLRLLRQMTSDGGSSGTPLTIGAVPRFIHLVVHRDQAGLNSWLSPVVSTQEAYCLGRSPSCLVPRHHLSVGTWMTVACQTRPTPKSTSPTNALARLEVADDTCDRWSAPAPQPKNARWSAPTFIAVGRYNTYQTAASLQTTRGIVRVTIAEDPAAGGGVMSRTECTLTARDRWLDQPDTVPDIGCLKSLTPTWD